MLSLGLAALLFALPPAAPGTVAVTPAQVDECTQEGT